MKQPSPLPELDTCPIRTLMIIDDSSFDQLICQRIIAKSGLVQELIQYIDPEKALDHLAGPGNLSPDLILLDINMPRMNGFEFLEAAQRRVDADLCPIMVMLDTCMDPAGEKRARHFPSVHGFFIKPLSKEKLQGFADFLRGTR